MERRIRKVYKRLPPHSYEAYPLTNSGEASKPLIIGIIAVVAVIALSLLLLFSDQFVGKALYSGQDYTAGLVYPPAVYEGQDFTLQVKANVGSSEIAGVEFQLNLPGGVNCKNFVEEFGADVSSFTCDPGVEKVIYLGGKSNAVNGELNIASITFDGVPAGKYVFEFNKFEVKKSDKSLIPFDNDVLEQSLLEVQAPVCGDGIVNKAGEQCDDGNAIDNDACSNNCVALTLPACTDNVKNGQETDVDCGGSDCPRCADTKMCLTNGDCLSGNCDDNGICKPALNTFICGNGILESGEHCDDGNVVDGDGCSATCQNEQSAQFSCLNAPQNALLCPGEGTGLTQNTQSILVLTCGQYGPTEKCGFTCNDGYHIQAGTCVANTCGDWLVNQPSEQCDDGNAVNGDGCSAACQSEAPIVQGVTAQGIKITLTDILPENGIFATNIKATQAFTEEVTIYTTLYDSNGKVLALKLEKLTGLDLNEVYTATMHYPEANVKTKSVIVYDVKQNPAVFGNLEVETS